MGAIVVDYITNNRDYPQVNIPFPEKCAMRNLVLVALALSLFSFSSAQAATAPSPAGCAPTTASYASSPSLVINNSATVTSSIEVQGLPPSVWDVDLRTFITHTFNADIDMTLTSPAGTIVTISSDNGGSNDNVFNGTLWDDSANPGGNVPYLNNPGQVVDNVFVNLTAASTLTPEEPLGAFVGENPNGLWTLTIVDDSTGEDGLLTGWSLDITSLPAAPTALESISAGSPAAAAINDNLVTESSLLLNNLNGVICDLSLSANITHTFAGDLEIALASPSGKFVTISTDNGGGFDNVFSATTWTDKADLYSPVPYGTPAPAIGTDFIYSNLVSPPLLTPEEGLSSLMGEDPNGIWKLRINDDAGIDTGSLNQWYLTVTSCSFPDQDVDGLGNACDGCPADAAKGSPGICGCGVVDTDSDGDSSADCLDACPADPLKSALGICGCGVVDADANGNGVSDCLLNQEFAARLDRAASLIKGLKLSKGKYNKSSKTKLSELKSLLAGFSPFVDSSISGMSVKSGMNIKRLTSSAVKAGKKLYKVRSSFSADKSAASRAIKNARAALA